MATIRGLIKALEEQAEAYGDDAEVRMVTQYNWPFEYAILGVTSNIDIQSTKECGYICHCSACPEMENCEDVDMGKEADNAEPIIYLVEGSQLCYGSKDAWENLQRID